ncbi:MAG: septal ring lytic transglycosylase RlpA family protein [Leptolyngbyaceae cyanobacterium MAG.088]|nr:septal ring lytic transglycosylase RlpA family protein [Leptolyngbyaceae cyanobacterium MAG.088]
MNKNFLGGLVTVALLSTCTPVSELAYAQSLDTNLDEALEISITEQSLEAPSINSLRKNLGSAATVRVNAHAHQDRQAATIYVQSIPVLTFVGPSDSGDIISGWLTLENSITEGALADAVQMAAQLEQLNDDAADLTAHWDDGSYVVMAGESPLVTMGDSIQLPDATEDAAEDVLQVTNRLRRLLGDGEAEPVTEVIGRPAPPPAPPQRVAAVRSSYSGMASWYGPGFHGRTSASGEAFNQYAMTAAHRTLPFGTQVRVTNLNNGRQVVVRINDRGPFSGGRIIDLSAGAASAIGLQSAGVGPVQIEVLR